MTKLQLTKNGDVVGIVTINGNSVDTEQFTDEGLEQTFAKLDGMTGYNALPPNGEDTDHIDEITPMEEPQVIANVEMVAGVNSLGVTDA